MRSLVILCRRQLISFVGIIMENAIRRLERIPEPECSQFIASVKAQWGIFQLVILEAVNVNAPGS